MKSDNELIEDFYVSKGGKPHLEADVYFYESDWNMIMPVANKIVKLWLEDTSLQEKLRNDSAFIARMAIKQMFFLSEITHDLDINSVYLKCLDIIKWYNENK